MSKPLKIDIINRTDTEDFEQLKKIIERFTINTHVRNKPENSESKRGYELEEEAIKEYEGKKELSVLTKEDIEQLKKDIDLQINTAKESIENKTNENTQTRYYILKDGDKIVGFQQAQLVKGKVDGRVEGWRNLAYIEKEYSGKSGQVIDSKGDLHRDSYSKVLYFDEIGKWFEENGVNYERTCTGVNMFENIGAYITALKFLPFDKNDKVIFLEKYKDKKIERSTLKKAYKLYHDHILRDNPKSKDEIIEEIDNVVEFENLTEEQKEGLLRCYQKEDEKEFEIPPEKMELANKFVEELKKIGMNVELKDIPQLIDSEDEKVKMVRDRILFGEKEIEEDNANSFRKSLDSGISLEEQNIKSKEIQKKQKLEEKNNQIDKDGQILD